MKLFQIPILLLILVSGCKEEYYPKIASGEQSVLVVEGVLNSGDGPTSIRLTRSIKLDDPAQVRPETAAQLTVEGTSGAVFPLYDLSGTGNYISEQLLLNPEEQYKLRIRTSDGAEYESDFVPVLKNPPIDSISWKRGADGVAIFVNTHNPENNTRYYRWEFDETWEIRSAYFANPIPDDGILEPLLPGENIYYCWKYHNSSELVLGTTAQLSSDIIFEKPLIEIPDGNDKLSVRYTVLVRQFALDKKGYDFYQLMKKNTESLGSIFDAQPTEIGGNIRSVSNPDARIIGYITASSIDTSRIWITKAEVPNWKPWMDCSQTKILNGRNDDVESYIKGDWLIYYIQPFSDNIYIAQRECVSCRLRGGSTRRPSYW